MYLTRAQTSKKIPVPRKGTAYVARALSHVWHGVPVVIAVRDMLKLAHTAKEVKTMVKDCALKINGRAVKDYRETILLFNIFEADKKYKLSILPTGRFILEKTSDKTRIAKVVGKTILKKNTIQINLHDGTNLITKEKINVGDSLELNTDNTIRRVIQLEKNARVFIESGKSIGKTGIVNSMGGKFATIKIGEQSVTLRRDHLIAL